MTGNRTWRAVTVCVMAALWSVQSGVVSADSLNIAGNVSLTVNSATSIGGGLAPDSAGTTYSVTNTLGTKKIVGRISSSMPTHTELTVAMAAPSGATSEGTVTLTSSDRNLVTGIGVVVESGLDMTFTFSATVSAGVINGNRTLTMTLVDTP